MNSMLTFLRKIRRSFINISSAQKYLIYAIGEIALVVIGILIALQINTWNEWRKERVLEKDILIEIKNTAELNSNLIQDHLAIIDNLNETSEKVISFIKSDNTYLPEYEEDFYYCFYSGTNIYLLNDGYERLTNSGLEIIQNNDLRKAIVDLFGVRFFKSAEFVNYIKEHFNSYETFLVQNFITEEKKLIPMDFAELRRKIEFIAIVKRMKERRNRVYSNLEKCLHENDDLLILINAELNKLN